MTQTDGEQVVQDEEETPATHQAASRRGRMREIEAMFSTVAVPVGSQQAGAISTIKDRARVLALVIHDRCPPGTSRERAIQATLEATMWAVHAVTHR